MPLNRPNGIALLHAIRQWLKSDVQPGAAASVAFDAQIAARLLDVLEREWALGDDFTAREKERLADLLGRAGEADALNGELSERIRNGGIVIDERLLKCLRQIAVAKLEIENPRYSAYRRSRAMAES